MRLTTSFALIGIALSAMGAKLPADTLPTPEPAKIPALEVTARPPQAFPVDSASLVPLTLDQCIEIALSENPTIKVRDMEINRIDYSKKEVRSQLLPSISFGASYNRMLAKQVAYMNMSAFGGLGGGSSATNPDGDDGEGTESPAPAAASAASKGIKMGLDNSYTVGFSGSLPLIAPQLWKNLKLSDAQIEEAYENARTSRIDMVNQVKSAYYGLLLAEDSYRVLLQSYDMAALTASIYEKKFAVGAASEYDVLRTRVALQNIEPDILQAEIAIKQAKLSLTLLMGFDPNINIVAADCLKNYEGTMYETALNIDKDIKDNSSLRLLDIQTQQLELALDIKKLAWYPTLALTASYQWTSMNDGVPFKSLRWNPYSVVGLTLSLPLYTGGQRYYAIKQSEIQLAEMQWQRENLVRSINMQVDLAVDNINRNIRQIASQSDNLGQANKAYEIMKRSFEIGAASYLDLRDAELALTRTQLSYYQSVYNYLIACSELDHLLGRTDVSKFMPAK